MVIWLYLKELKCCMEILCSNVIFPLQIYANWPRDLYMYNYITLTVNSPRILEINRCLFLADAFNHTSFNTSGLIKQNKVKVKCNEFYQRRARNCFLVFLDRLLFSLLQFSFSGWNILDKSHDVLTSLHWCFVSSLLGYMKWIMPPCNSL